MLAEFTEFAISISFQDMLLLLLLPAAGFGGQKLPAVCKGWPSAGIPFQTNVPEAHMMRNGTMIGPSDGPLWQEHQAEIGSLLQEWMYGTLPKDTPPLVSGRFGAKSSRA